MLLRPMREEDWENSVELRLRALGESPGSYRQTLEDETERLRTARWVEPSQRGAEAPDLESWVAEVNGLAVGQAFSRLTDDGSTVHISAMWVAPEVRGQGVGRALLVAAEAWGRDRGVARGYLAVTEGNSAAERLYTRAGYEPTGDREPLREDSDLECVWMAKPL